MADGASSSNQTRKTRAASRVPIEAHVQLRSGTRRSQIKVHDLSTHGARISFAHVMREGDQIYLTLPGLAALAAEVAWVNNFEAGCRFAAPIHPSVFARLVGTSA